MSATAACSRCRVWHYSVPAVRIVASAVVPCSDSLAGVPSLLCASHGATAMPTVPCCLWTNCALPEPVPLHYASIWLLNDAAANQPSKLGTSLWRQLPASGQHHAKALHEHTQHALDRLLDPEQSRRSQSSNLVQLRAEAAYLRQLCDHARTQHATLSSPSFPVRH